MAVRACVYDPGAAYRAELGSGFVVRHFGVGREVREEDFALRVGTQRVVNRHYASSTGRRFYRLTPAVGSL